MLRNFRLPKTLVPVDAGRTGEVTLDDCSDDEFVTAAGVPPEGSMRGNSPKASRNWRMLALSPALNCNTLL